MGLRKASGNTHKIDMGDGDYLTVKDDLPKGEWNNLLKQLPADAVESKKITLGAALDFQEALFAAFVTEMVVEGKSEKVGVQGYRALDSVSGEAVDRVLIEHFNSIAPSKEEQGKPTT